MAAGTLNPAECLCGAVQFSAQPARSGYGVCHCSMCRRWSGGTFMGVVCNENVEFDDVSSLKTFKSSEWGERGFCNECGTSLFWKVHGADHYVVSVAAFKNIGEVVFESEIFIDDKPSHYEFANKTHTMTGAEVFAMFASEGPEANG